MPGLLSGSALRSGGSQTFIQLFNAQPQLPPTLTTSTGYTIVTDNLLQTTYRSSLGNIEMNSGTMYSNFPNKNITLLGTGTGAIVVDGGALAISTNTGALQVIGGIGTSQDINVNGVQIGRGYQGTNNIVVRGTAETLSGDGDVGQSVIAIGYDTMLGLQSGYKAIAIGRYALHSGTNISNSIAIGDSALESVGNYQQIAIGNVVSMTQSTATVVTVINHGLSTGTQVNIIGMTAGPVEINYQNLWVKTLTTNTLALYVDNILGISLDTSGLNPYVGGGILGRIVNVDDNISIGVNAGKLLIDGKQNLFVGDMVAEYITTGSYNIFLGHEVGNNMTNGNANISIGGDNLVDGQDDQVNIGSVFYFNGQGNLYLNADTLTGLGTSATSVSNGAFNVVGGAGITGDLYIGGTLHVLGADNSVIQGNLVLNEGLIATGNQSLQLSPSGANVYIQPSVGGTVIISPTQGYPGSIDNMTIGATTPQDGTFLNLHATSNTAATSTTTGALQVIGGAGIGGDLWVGGFIHGNISGASTSQGVYVTTATTETYYFGLTSIIGTSYNIYSSVSLSYNGNTGVLTTPQLTVTSTSTSSVSLAGGMTVAKSIYSADGNPQQGYLLYTPRVTVSTSTPLLPNIGDFWIDPTYGVELQFIQDGTSTFWVQFAGL